MRADTLASALGFTGLLVSAVIALRAPQLAPAAPASPATPFPPPPTARPLDLAARGGLPAVLALDPEVARLGRAAPRLEPLRRAFLEAPNLTQFALERLPLALTGDGASQYFIYLALDQCRAYLRRDLESARLNLESMLNVPDLGPQERAAWRAEYERCRGFGLGGWDAIGQAIGMDEPGSEAEYASLWFERSVQSGYPTALVEMALRPSPFAREEREALLQQALPQAGPDAYWLLFAHSGDVPTGETGVDALAWLLVACRAGQDCTEDARWYRSFICTTGEGQCPAGQSALQYYWSGASPGERDAAWTQSRLIESALAAGRWEDLPLPDLDRLQYRPDQGP